MLLIRFIVLLCITCTVYQVQAQELKNITPFEDSIKSIIIKLPEVQTIDSLVRVKAMDIRDTQVLVRLMARPSPQHPVYEIAVGSYSDARYNDHLFLWKTFYYDPAKNEILINVNGHKPMTMANYRKWQRRGPSISDRILSVFGTRCK